MHVHPFNPKIITMESRRFIRSYAPTDYKYLTFQTIKYFRSRTIGLNTSRDRIFPSLNWGIAENVSQFQTCAGCEKDLKDNKHNSIPLRRKYARIFSLDVICYALGKLFASWNR